MNRLAKIVLGLLVLIIVLTCSTRKNNYADLRNVDDRTLRVFNETGSHVHIYIGGRKVGVATSGENCFDLKGIGRGYQHLSVRPTAGQKTRTMTPEDFHNHDWSMRLQMNNPRDLKYDLLSLQPSEPCKG